MHTTQLTFHKRYLGFGLVEIMVALALSSFLIAGVMQVYLANRQSYRMAEGLSRLQENARFAMRTLSKELEPGGFRGCLLANEDNVVNTLALNASAYDFGIELSGTEGADGAPDSVTITRAVGQSGIPVVAPMATQRDSLTLDAGVPAYADLQQYQTVTISDCAAAATFMITNDPQSSIISDNDLGQLGIIEHQTGIVAPQDGLNPGQSNATDDLQYYFGAETGSVAMIYPATSTQISLATDIDGKSWLMSNDKALIEGVQDLQITYGLPAGDNVQYVSASAALDWDAVESMRIELTLDSVEPATGSGTPAMLDKVYARTFRVRNRNP